jgi:hypothetical protein
MVHRTQLDCETDRAESTRIAMLRRKKIKPITLRDVTIIDDANCVKRLPQPRSVMRWNGSILVSTALWPMR